MLLELKHYMYLHFCPHTFKRFFDQYFYINSDEIFFTERFSKCDIFKKAAAVVCYSCPFDFVDLSFIDNNGFESYSDVLFAFKQYLKIFAFNFAWLVRSFFGEKSFCSHKLFEPVH